MESVSGYEGLLKISEHVNPVCLTWKKRTKAKPRFQTKWALGVIRFYIGLTLRCSKQWIDWVGLD